MHTILWNKIHFLELNISKDNVNTISSVADLIEGSERDKILLASETRLCHNLNS